MVVHVGNHHSFAEMKDNHHHISLHIMIKLVHIGVNHKHKHDGSD